MKTKDESVKNVNFNEFYFFLTCIYVEFFIFTFHAGRRQGYILINCTNSLLRDMAKLLG